MWKKNIWLNEERNNLGDVRDFVVLDNFFRR